MATPSRRAFLALAQKAIIAGAVGGIAVCAVEDAQAMPLAPDPRGHGDSSDLLKQVQWGPGWGPGWGRPPPPRRRWVCRWRRGRRICGWRWV
jgi:hypothetical protein